MTADAYLGRVAVVGVHMLLHVRFDADDGLLAVQTAEHGHVNVFTLELRLIFFSICT
jgi:hypothetical protein